MFTLNLDLACGGHTAVSDRHHRISVLIRASRRDGRGDLLLGSVLPKQTVFSAYHRDRSGLRNQNARRLFNDKLCGLDGFQDDRKLEGERHRSPVKGSVKQDGDRLLCDRLLVARQGVKAILPEDLIFLQLLSVDKQLQSLCFQRILAISVYLRGVAGIFVIPCILFKGCK